MTINDNTVSKQWASRPDDQRFLTVEDLYNKVSQRRQECEVHNVALDAMTLGVTDDGFGLTLGDKEGHVGGLLNHWSFGQLCSRAGAPAGYLRKLPATLAAIPLQYSLETHETKDDEGNNAKALIRKNGNTWFSAITSPTYGRIWDKDVVAAVRNNVDLTQWKVPSASYSVTDPKKATTLYASDRDVFMFLVNEENSIDVEGESLKRGFYVYNSEVGASTFHLAAFSYDRVCDNRIIWGQKDLKTLTIRHTAGGPHRFIAQAAPQIRGYINASSAGQAETVRIAKATEVGKDKDSVLKWMRERGFAVGFAKQAYQAAEADVRGYNPRSVWGIVQGATEAAHDITHTDTRVEIETKAGALLEALSE